MTERAADLRICCPHVTATADQFVPSRGLAAAWNWGLGLTV